MSRLRDARQSALATGRDGADPSHGGAAAQKRGARNHAHQRAVRDWNAISPDMPDPSEFTRDILPGLHGVPIGVLTQATGLSAGYIGLIRGGKHIPHPRHWEALRKISGL